MLLFLDIDECSSDQNNCSVNSICTNTIGSYQCSCFSGYRDEGMGYVCTGLALMMHQHFVLLPNSPFLEIDECLRDPCDSNATCTNTAGSYICECNTGFTDSGVSCTSRLEHIILAKVTIFRFLDINECQNATKIICDGNATCSDTEGSYECMCNTGYSGDGLTCTSKCYCSNTKIKGLLNIHFTSLLTNSAWPNSYLWH